MQARHQLGMLYQWMGRYYKAEEHYRQIIRHNAQDTAARYQLAILCQETGREAEAEAILTELLAIDRRNSLAQAKLSAIRKKRRYHMPEIAEPPTETEVSVQRMVALRGNSSGEQILCNILTTSVMAK